MTVANAILTREAEHLDEINITVLFIDQEGDELIESESAALKAMKDVSFSQK